MLCSIIQQQSILILGKRVAEGVRDEEPEPACKDEGVLIGDEEEDL